MPPISAESRVAALFAAALGTGIYLVTLGYAIRWLVFSDSGRLVRKHINWIMLSASLAIFACSSVHVILAIRDTVIAVRISNIPHPTNTKTDWSATVMCTVVNISILIVDAVLIYRCWLTYSKRKAAVIFPGVIWLGGLVCTILQAYWQIVQSASIVTAWHPVNMSIGPGTILTPFWSATIVINIYATSLIVYKIWSSASEIEPHIASKDLSFTIRVLIESGALYLIVAIPHFIVWFTPSSAAIVFFGWLNLPVAGTAFNLILIRISKNRADSEEKKNGYGPTMCSTGTNMQFTTSTLHQSEEGEMSAKITFGEDSVSSTATHV